ncbi:kinase-like domain-containing protein [Lactarius akahatsu]|uniref:Kinase-like domain-containing protein n=1 Tax=Lactarius akahatsu TaxID=416441 RepID=A0AAD4LDR5_9AGAM|nr:kinase-like domain-containing protein [Lactarius akahatsu]
MTSNILSQQYESYLDPGGPYQALSSHEITWRDRQQFLESKGYMLRPRLRPGWTPSWLETGTYWRRAEDSAKLPGRPLLVDATRIVDGKLVYIKEVQTNDEESRIALLLNSYEDIDNHSVPILDTFVDPTDETISYLVMPFLRLLNEPPFESIGEILDFVDQILKGLTFMHSKGVAHRDCSPKNILMDAANMYPLGFHPVRDIYLHDVSTLAPIIPRSEVGVKYYFVDYGISSYFPAGSQERLVLGTAGRDQDVPELSDVVPYDPFKVDIFTIGNVFRQVFRDKYSNCQFFTPIIESMMRSNPADRPSAADAFQQWRSIRSGVRPLDRFWRPRGREETSLSSFVYDLVHIFTSITYTLQSLRRRLRRSIT